MNRKASLMRVARKTAAEKMSAYEKKKILTGIREAINELDLIKRGKKTGRSAEDLLKEL